MYPTLAQVKDHLKIATLETDADDVLTRLCQVAQAFIEGPEGAGRKFEVSADTTRYFDCAPPVVEGRTLWLDHDLCQLTSITNGDGVAVTLSNVVKHPRNETPWYQLELKLSSDTYWTWEDSPEGAIAIVGRWGYSLTPPADIVQAGIDLVAWLYHRRDNAGDADRTVVTKEGMVIRAAKLPSMIMDVLVNRRSST